jgi:hypothetical protein
MPLFWDLIVEVLRLSHRTYLNNIKDTTSPLVIGRVIEDLSSSFEYNLKFFSLIEMDKFAL